MHVEIVNFPETKVAAICHLGPPWLEHDTVKMLVAWKREHGLLDPVKYRHYGLHYTDPRTIEPSQHRVEFCLSTDQPITENAYGIHEKTIPAARCARARDIGSRSDNQAVRYLMEKWLPTSGEILAGPPAIFHYVNVGPQVAPNEAITDVYLPLK